MKKKQLKVVELIAENKTLRAELDKCSAEAKRYRDVAEKSHEKSEERFLKNTALLKAITKVQSQFITNTNPRTLFEELLTTLLLLTDSTYGFIGEIFYNQNGDPYLKTKAITNIAWNEETRALYDKYAAMGMEFTNLNSLFGTVLTTGKQVISNCPSTDPRRCGIPEGHPPLNAFLGLPFYNGDIPVGMIGLANRPGGYDTELIDYINPILATCSHILEGYRIDQKRKQIEKAHSESEASLKNANRALKTLSDFNIAISKSSDEQTLLQRACDIVVGSGGYRMAWTGYVEQDAYKSVKPVASAGYAAGYLDNAKITWADTERGKGPTGTAIRSAIPAICRNVVSDPNFMPWREEAVRRGYKSIISLPLKLENKVQGVINIYASEPDAFTENEAYFLKELAENLSFGIAAIRSNLENQQINIEKKRLEENLIHMHRVDAIGQLAGGIAHDFNNLLTAIIISGSLLEKLAKNDTQILKHACQILRTAERAASLTKGLLAFSRKQVIEREPAFVNDVIKESVKLISRLIGADIELKVRLLEIDKVILADAAQIEQVLMNLATNARDAMPKGGRLEIETAVVELDSRFKELHGFDATGTTYALITVSDTGEGIDEATKEKIFEPFFTTKDVDKGTGLGLSIVYGIIKQHEGHIIVESERGVGTSFKIYLPIKENLTVKADKNQDEVSVKGGTETILLAEDSDEVRRLVKSTLEDFGYEVILARDGDEAIDKLIESYDRVNLLILDVIMPKRTGKEVYDMAMELNPGLKTIFVSGYNDEIIHRRGILLEELHFLSKPYVPGDLLKKIRVVLDDEIN